ncbi:helix-turn-helix domain-containing protein [Neorickettsia findlayensis]|uniref:Helix-turn-helix domain-containing protein n=1 Tax=Neorickettsia findlayensis TaxID=2686014 RepID=A0A6P1GA89_9RICK|nr:helix-turn-helix domain-containing protein [Neorickettsia findlayensis]QHD65228.1 helix-turn-helix domain-containing protein [Neorickettsia findlayensis]
MTKIADQITNVMAYKIRKRMGEIGINARELAERAGVGKSFVYDILNGKSKNPTSKKLNSISRELGISISYLINVSPDSIDYENYLPVHSLDNHLGVSFLLNRAFCEENISEACELYSCTMYDDSMLPSIMPNETLIIKKFVQGDRMKSGVFLIRDKFNSIVRSVEHIFGSQDVKITPDNEKYSTYIKHFDEIDIIGKVIFTLRRL